MQTSVDFTKLEFDHLIYTGSSDIAKKVSAAAATNLVPLTLELGGKKKGSVAAPTAGLHFDDKIISVLPAKYPNLLVNGAGGIAVGMATNILPHNLGEVIDATIAFIKNKKITDSEINNFINDTSESWLQHHHLKNFVSFLFTSRKTLIHRPTCEFPIHT